MDAENPLAAEWDNRLERMLAGDDGIAETGGLMMDLCPGQTNEGQSPEDVAEPFIRTIPLPEMQIEIRPGYALTGMPAYVEVGNQDDFQSVHQIDGWGQLTVDFEFVRVDVDWDDGNGTISYPAGVRGEPWNGRVDQQISTTYDLLDPDTVVAVTAHWTALWTLDGFDGAPVDGLSTSSTYALPVREYRAVRGNPSG